MPFSTSLVLCSRKSGNTKERLSFVYYTANCYSVSILIQKPRPHLMEFSCHYYWSKVCEDICEWRIVCRHKAIATPERAVLRDRNSISMISNRFFPEIRRFCRRSPLCAALCRSQWHGDSILCCICSEWLASVVFLCIELPIVRCIASEIFVFVG